MSTRNQRLNARMCSLDAMKSGMHDISKAAVFSDRGEGVERMADELDRTPESESLTERDAVSSRFRKIEAARISLHRAGLGYLVPTFLLICRNGSNRKESIGEIAWRHGLARPAAERLYFVHRAKLLEFFGITPAGSP